MSNQAANVIGERGFHSGAMIRTHAICYFLMSYSPLLCGSRGWGLIIKSLSLSLHIFWLPLGIVFLANPKLIPLRGNVFLLRQFIQRRLDDLI